MEPSQVISREIHGFCDASQKAYAAVLYVRVILRSGEIKVTLVAAKTKVPRLKKVTLPRLKLCAAVLFNQLYESIVKVISSSVDKVMLWSDSQIVLSWIRSERHKFKAFVANRVAQIQSILSSHVWHHVSGKDNPANAASRGIIPRSLVTLRSWWCGPSRLLSDCSVPVALEHIDNPEKLRVSFPAVYKTVVHREPEFIQKFSTYNRLIRVIA